MSALCVGRCGIYGDRPKFCRDYPQVQDFLPPKCTFSFVGSERRGECQPEVCQEDCCCAYPREGGNPEGVSLDSLAGGQPCKHLVWIESPLDDPEKLASGEEPDIITSAVVSLLGEA